MMRDAKNVPNEKPFVPLRLLACQRLGQIRAKSEQRLLDLDILG